MIPAASHRPRRKAFTLVEMLMVIGLLMLLLGLSIGAVMRTPVHDRLLGTEQLLSDMIRQTRHTARSTGAPVLLIISSAPRTISGVSQTPIWSEGFDEATLPTIASDWYLQAGSATQQRNLGQTGYGLVNPAGWARCRPTSPRRSPWPATSRSPAADPAPPPRGSTSAAPSCRLIRRHRLQRPCLRSR